MISPRRVGRRNVEARNRYLQQREKGFDMGFTQDRVPSYNGLFDPNLRDHWDSKPRQKLLKKVGVVDRLGRPVFKEPREKRPLPTNSVVSEYTSRIDTFRGILNNNPMIPSIGSDVFLGPEGKRSWANSSALHNDSPRAKKGSKAHQTQAQREQRRRQHEAKKKEEKIKQQDEIPEGLADQNEAPLLVICGVSGCNKDILTARLIEENEACFEQCISHTTRPPKDDEVNGTDYYFVSKEEMDEATAADRFVETAEIDGEVYGTSKKEVQRVLASGKIPVLLVDIQGVMALRLRPLPSRFVFIKPSSVEALRERLQNEGVPEEEINSRLKNADLEMQYGNMEGFFDKILIEDDEELPYHEFREYVGDLIEARDPGGFSIVSAREVAEDEVALMWEIVSDFTTFSWGSPFFTTQTEEEDPAKATPPKETEDAPEEGEAPADDTVEDAPADDEATAEVETRQPPAIATVRTVTMMLGDREVVAEEILEEFDDEARTYTYSLYKPNDVFKHYQVKVTLGVPPPPEPVEGEASPEETAEETPAEPEGVPAEEDPYPDQEEESKEEPAAGGPVLEIKAHYDVLPHQDPALGRKLFGSIMQSIIDKL